MFIYWLIDFVFVFVFWSRVSSSVLLWLSWSSFWTKLALNLDIYLPLPLSPGIKGVCHHLPTMFLFFLSCYIVIWSNLKFVSILRRFLSKPFERQLPPDGLNSKYLSRLPPMNKNIFYWTIQPSKQGTKHWYIIIILCVAPI